jgi:glutathione S-transferase
MKLYFSPGACSLADHIAMHEAGLAFEAVQVNLRAKTLSDGRDYKAINPKGYVPALEFNDGQVLTENVAILSWIGDQSAALTPKDDFARYRQLEMLTFISTEIHKSFGPLFTPGTSDEDKAKATAKITGRLAILGERLQTADYLLGDDVSTADCYLFVMLTWAKRMGITIPDPMPAFFARMAERPAVKAAMQHEGLL